jgi:nitrous oxidase accessory protein NosD
VNRANTGDIVLIRPGRYNEPMTINKAITLRATRGDALIGVP